MLTANEELNEATTFAPALLGYCNDLYRKQKLLQSQSCKPSRGGLFPLYEVYTNSNNVCDTSIICKGTTMLCPYPSVTFFFQIGIGGIIGCFLK
ncbi:hypothetical protein NIES4072_25290 [Nostoc commune NIES-4072]|uniref:Uncharacterized protein n=1 Tax=Nostoc commune NIES-4072 TaxID=2005467 RepID=A0A2R5FT62_NOSCO|nr:hypothetical protein NIES4070_01570 [Nostoc commune HK-02]GBG18864.1 hypothetical protein NIES4072_25290 [Nostoc commune NIES-4072]